MIFVLDTTRELAARAGKLPPPASIIRDDWLRNYVDVDIYIIFNNDYDMTILVIRCSI